MMIENIYKCQDECQICNKQYRHIVTMNTDRKNTEMKFVMVHINYKECDQRNKLCSFGLFVAVVRVD